MSIDDNNSIARAAQPTAAAVSSSSTGSPAAQAHLLRRSSGSGGNSNSKTVISSRSSPSPLPHALSSSSSSSSPLPSPRSFSPIHPEPDKRGNLEYKLRILPVSANRFSRLVTQLKWRLAEGGGLAVYEIGVLDDGTLIGLPRDEMRCSLAQLALMGRELGACCEVRRCIVVERGGSGAQDVEGEETAVSSSSLPAADAEGPEVLPSPDHLVPYRHRLGSSSKNQSPGLDNIVGLRSLNNAEAANLLGHATDATTQHSSSWRYEIAPHLSDSGNGDTTVDAEDEDSGSEVAHDDEEEQDDDGFAFSLSLSDDDATAPPASTSPSLPRKSRPADSASRPRRTSKSVSNSPWQRFSSPATTSVASPVLQPSTTPRTTPAATMSSNLNSGSEAQDGACSSSPTSTPPLDAHGDESPSPRGATSPSSSRGASPFSTRREPKAIAIKPTAPPTKYAFTDLAGMDVEGVLTFALPPPPPKEEAPRESGAVARRRRQREAKRLARLNNMSNGQAAPEPANASVPPAANDSQVSHSPSPQSHSMTSKSLAKGPSYFPHTGPTPSPSPVAGSRATPPLSAPEEVLRLSQERKSTKRSHQRRSKGGDGSDAILSGAKLERRARRVAEHKAKEREGEGILLAMDCDHLDDAVDFAGPSGGKSRQEWWRFSGKSLEADLPFFDPTRQAWVRDVAVWLTVDEVFELARSWHPDAAVKLGRSGEGKEIGSDADEHARNGEDGHADNDAGPSTEGKEEEKVSRKSQGRRRRKEKKKVEAQLRLAAESAALSGGYHPPASQPSSDSSNYPPGYVARPSYLPPPTSAVAIPPLGSKPRHRHRHRSRNSLAGPDSGSSPASHPLARSQTYGEDEDEEEDSFSVGLTMNIDDYDSMAAARKHAPAAPGSAASPSPSSSTTTTGTTTGMMARMDGGAAEKMAGESGVGDAEQPAQLRFIVEAVLSLNTLRRGRHQ